MWHNERVTGLKFMFDEEKAAQAAACLLKLHGGRLDYARLLTLLYLADRQSLVETGCPITGARLMGLPVGPLAEQIFDLIRGAQAARTWSCYVAAPVDNRVALAAADPANDSLSEYESDVLAEVHDTFGRMDDAQLKEHLHGLPEWRRQAGEALEIDPVEILRAAGQSEEMIADAVAHARDALRFGQLAASSA
jgi:Protein of unknown function (DUF4065)